MIADGRLGMKPQKKVIAVCGAQLYEEKEFSFLSRLNNACRELGYVVLTFNLSTDPRRHDSEVVNEKPLIDMIPKFPIDALVIMSESVKVPEMREYIKESVKDLNIPVFALDRHIEGCINIASDFGDGFSKMVRHVINVHGCRKINMIAGLKDNDFSEERIQAYKDVLAENGIPFEEKRLAYGDFWDRPARAAVKGFIDSGDIPEAIVCANDTMAIAACSVLHENGFRVPEDVIVTGYDGIMSGRLNFPPISTVAPDYEKEVGLILELMKAYYEDRLPDTEQTRYIDYIVRENRSCGCVSNDNRVTAELVNKLSYAFNDQKWQVAAMNKLLLSAAEKQHIQELTSILEDAVELWEQNYYYVGIHSELIHSEHPSETNDNSYVSLFHMQHGSQVKTCGNCLSSVIPPDFRNLLQNDDEYGIYMLRLLFTDNDIYGYLIEGFNDIDIRSMRRCDEFGLFISTAVSEILKNEKLFWFNERLQQLNREMAHAAIHDPLTGLYNRRGFFDELMRISKASVGRYITIFSIDMDELKHINDNYGHNEGDIAITALAAAIRRFSARNGICARFGGDEFVCALITDRPLSLSPDTVRARLDSAMAGSKALQDKPYSISASIGYECVKMDTVLDFDSVLRKADEMMYSDKHARKKERMD